jgi:hypothetical protein
MREVVDRHLKGLDGLPTPEFVAAICKEFSSNSQKEKVLKFFLLESPLRARDLGVLLCGIGQNRARQICKEATDLREHRLARGKPFLWEEITPS